MIPSPLIVLRYGCIELRRIVNVASDNMTRSRKVKFLRYCPTVPSMVH